MLSHDKRILDKLLGTIHQAVAVPTRKQPTAAVLEALAFVREHLVRHGHGALVGDDKHPHPAAQQPQAVDRVEALAAAAHHGEAERAALRRPHAARRQRDPVNLVLEHGRQVAVLLRRHPEVPVRPARQLAQFLHFRVRVRVVVFHRQALWVVDAYVAAQAEEDAGDFVGQELRVGAMEEYVRLGCD